MDTKITLSHNNISYSLYPDPNCELMGRAISQGYYYEPDVTELLKKELKPDDIFIDIGACYGWFGFLAATVCKEVLMVEPRSDNFERIVNAKCYLHEEIANKIRLENCAVVPFNTPKSCCYIHAPFSNSNGILITEQFYNKHCKKHNEYYYVVGQTYLQILYKLSALPTFVKIDIEGMEYDVLSWAKLPPKLITEFSTVMMGETKAHRYARFLLASHKVMDIKTGEFLNEYELVNAAKLEILNLYCKEIQYDKS